VAVDGEGSGWADGLIDGVSTILVVVLSDGVVVLTGASEVI
jgi:hypothetical protein